MKASYTHFERQASFQTQTPAYSVDVEVAAVASGVGTVVAAGTDSWRPLRERHYSRLAFLIWVLLQTCAEQTEGPGLKNLEAQVGLGLPSDVSKFR